MREVERNKVPVPSCLTADLTSEIDKVRNENKINQSIYRDNEVLQNLKVLYVNKCYLCECDVRKENYVEHYLPWSSNFPERAYDWNNLHLSCNTCNQKKRKKEYKKFIQLLNGKKDVSDTLLLDPSNPPTGFKIEDLIGFQRNCKAFAKVTTDTKVIKTAQFLNEYEIKEERQNRWYEIEDFLFEYISYVQIWQKIIEEGDINIRAENPSEYKIALEKAYSFYFLFLDNNSPYSSCMKNVLFLSKKITRDDVYRLMEYYKELKTIA